MDGEERGAGPLNLRGHENASELSTSGPPPVHPPAGSCIPTTCVVQVIPVSETLRRSGPNQYQLDMRRSFSARSFASCTSSRSTTRCGSDFASLLDMVGVVFDVPERMIIPYGRLRLLEHEVLGKGAFGEVVLGEMYQTSCIARLRTPMISTVLNKFSSSPKIMGSSCEGVLLRAESCTEDRRYSTWNSRFLSPGKEVFGKTTTGCSFPSADKKKMLDGNHRRRNSVEQVTQSLPSPTLQARVFRPVTEMLSSQLTLDEDVLDGTTSSFSHPAVPLCSGESGMNVGAPTWSSSRSSCTEEIPKVVAVKRFDKARLSRRKKFITSFKTELQLASELCHPSIVKVHGVVEEASEFLLVMDLAEGGTLHDYLDKQALEDMAVMAPRFLADIVLGLEYLHAAGIAHCDIKPCNMLLTADHHIKLADFGSACHLSDDAGNTFAGTAAYMSPEMVETGKASATSDLWALGCVLFQLFVGRPPFQGENRMFVLHKVKAFRSGDVDFPPYFPSEVRDLVVRLLQRTPSDRLGSDETGGFAALKSHRFFADIDWSQVHQTPNTVLQTPDFSLLVKDLLQEGEKGSALYSRA